MSRKGKGAGDASQLLFITYLEFFILDSKSRMLYSRFQDESDENKEGLVRCLPLPGPT